MGEVLVGVRLLLLGAAEELVQDWQGRLWQVGGGQVGRAEERDDRLHAARLVRPPAGALQAVFLAGRAEHHRQVCAGREPDRADARRNQCRTCRREPGGTARRISASSTCAGKTCAGAKR